MELIRILYLRGHLQLCRKFVFQFSSQTMKTNNPLVVMVTRTERTMVNTLKFNLCYRLAWIPLSSVSCATGYLFQRNIFKSKSIQPSGFSKSDINDQLAAFKSTQITRPFITIQKFQRAQRPLFCLYCYFVSHSHRIKLFA